MLLEVQWLDQAFYPLPAVVALVQMVDETLFLMRGLSALEEGDELLFGEVGATALLKEQPDSL